jgi:hypothetical protein
MRPSDQTLWHEAIHLAPARCFGLDARGTFTSPDDVTWLASSGATEIGRRWPARSSPPRRSTWSFDRDGSRRPSPGPGDRREGSS